MIKIVTKKHYSALKERADAGTMLAKSPIHIAMLLQLVHLDDATLIIKPYKKCSEKTKKFIELFTDLQQDPDIPIVKKRYEKIIHYFRGER